MREYTTPVFDLDDQEESIGTLTVTADTWQEAEIIVDQWNSYEGGERWTASALPGQLVRSSNE